MGDKEQPAISLWLVLRHGALNHLLSPAASRQTLMAITAEPGPRRQGRGEWEGREGWRRPGPKRWEESEESPHDSLAAVWQKEQCSWAVNLLISPCAFNFDVLICCCRRRPSGGSRLSSHIFGFLSTRARKKKIGPGWCGTVFPQWQLEVLRPKTPFGPKSIFCHQLQHKKT